MTMNRRQTLEFTEAIAILIGGETKRAPLRCENCHNETDLSERPENSNLICRECGTETAARVAYEDQHRRLRSHVERGAGAPLLRLPCL